MKKVSGSRNLGAWIFTVFCMLVLTSSLAAAQTVLIGAGVRNGDFNADETLEGDRTFAQTPSWTNIGDHGDPDGQVATRTTSPVDGTRHATITSTSNRIMAQNTQHDLQEGDFFRVQYQWQNGFNFLRGADRVEVRLFVTDNDTIGGTQTVVATLLSRLNQVDGEYQLETAISPVIDPALVGKRLFVQLVTTQSGANTSFANLDNFELVVNPEPVSAILIGAGIRNGDFNADTSLTDARNFDSTPVWRNIGTGGQEQIATRTNNPVDGTRHAVITSTESRVMAQDTTHSLQPGDFFRVRYQWRNGSTWATGNDRVEVRLFVTDDNTISGEQTVVGSLPSRLIQTSLEYQDELAVTPLVDPALTGKRLFVQLTVDRELETTAFAFLDNFELAVNPEPEPATLIGAGIRNGDFNLDTSLTDQRNFDSTPFWRNIGGGQEQIATRTNTPVDGTRHAVLSSSPSRITAQDTLHDLQPGNFFQVSYQWRNGSAAIPWTMDRDRVEVRLFVTDNDLIGGEQTEVARLRASLLEERNEYQDQTSVSRLISSEYAGKRLFVALDVSPIPETDDTRFAFLDNFELLVNPEGVDPAPEPTPDPPEIASVSIVAGELTLSVTGTEEIMPLVEYTLDLVNPDWQEIVPTGSETVNGTTTWTFDLEGDVEAAVAFFRVVDNQAEGE